MNNTTHNPDGVAPPFGSYSHGVAAGPNARWLCISGQVGVHPDGTPAETAAEQCELAFKNLLAVLEAEGMVPEDLVRLGVFLTDTEDFLTYRAARKRMLGDQIRPCSTLVYVPHLADPAWRVEIEAWAARA